MVQGLGFLSKKSWHTKNLANQEKVWMAEQRKEAETQKTKELAKQIQQEREQDELEKISGKKGTRLDRGIDWMYQGNTGDLAKEDAEKQAEEFLLGKEYVGEGAVQGDFDEGDRNQGINIILKQTAEEPSASMLAEDPSRYEPSVKDRNEDFLMRLEDPMFMVNKKQHEKESRHTETKALYERVLGYQEDDGNAKAGRIKSKMEKKRHTKKKSSKGDRDHHSDDDSSQSNHRRRHKKSRRNRSRSPDRHRSRRRERSPSYDSKSNSTRDNYHDRRRDRRDSRRDNERPSRRRVDDSSKKRSRYRSRSDSEESSRHGADLRRTSEDGSGRRDGDRRVQSPRRQHGRSHEDGDREHRSHGNRHDDQDVAHRTSTTEKPTAASQILKDGYGLIGGAIKVDRNDLGPDRELLNRRRQEQEEERRRIKEMSSNRRQRSDHERARELAEMQANARRREEGRARRDGSNNNDDGQDVPKTRDATFLTDMTRQVHGIGEGGQNLSARVAQNRHTNQRLHDQFL